MKPQNSHEWPFSGPIHPDWTLAQLLEWLSNDEQLHERLDDAELGVGLARIEAAASRLAGAGAWAGAPSAIALLRSLAALRLRAPALGAMTLGAIGLGAAGRRAAEADETRSADAPRQRRSPALAGS